MITIENLCKAYNDKILFKNFHLEIPDSRFLVISGESGCGKSTLLNMIGGKKRKKAEIFQRSCWIFISKFCPFGKQNSKRKSRNNKKIR